MMEEEEVKEKEVLFSPFWVFMIKFSTVIIVSASIGALIGRLTR